MRSALVVGISWLLLISVSVAAPANDKEKDKEPAAQIVDAGSFGVFMNGRRVATEKFSIQQDSTRKRRHF